MVINQFFNVFLSPFWVVVVVVSDCLCECVFLCVKFVTGAFTVTVNNTVGVGGGWGVQGRVRGGSIFGSVYFWFRG